MKTENEFTRMLQTAAGDKALACNYQDIWGTYCEQSDTGAARAAFKDVVKFATMSLRQKEVSSGANGGGHHRHLESGRGLSMR